MCMAEEGLRSQKIQMKNALEQHSRIKVSVGTIKFEKKHGLVYSSLQMSIGPK